MTWFRVDRSRGQPAVKQFFGKVFKGILIADFWGAYNALRCSGKQRCLAHLLRELKKVTNDNPGSSEWKQFAKPLKRILRDALRLRVGRSGLSEEVYASRVSRIEKRFSDFIDTSVYSHPDAKRLLKRLRRHRNEILTFLHHAEVPSDNNHAERSIRGAVIMRKNSYCNRSLRGAQSQAILMSVFAMLKQRKLNPTGTILAALAERMTTNILPPLPISPSVD